MYNMGDVMYERLRRERDNASEEKKKPSAIGGLVLLAVAMILMGYGVACLNIHHGRAITNTLAVSARGLDIQQP